MTDEKKKSPYDILKESPMFQLSLASKELFHSNFLAWIGSLPNRDNEEHPFKRLMKGLGVKNVDKWPKEWYVAREYKNFDLCVLSRLPDEFLDEDKHENRNDGTDNKENANLEDKEPVRVHLVLENKMKSIPYVKQLNDYLKKATQINNRKKQKNRENTPLDCILLTMATSFPDQDVVNKKWIIKSYKDLEGLLNGILNIIEDGYSKRVIEDYKRQLEALNSLHEIWCPKEEKEFCNNSFLYFTTCSKTNKKNNVVYRRNEYRFDYLTLKQLRIHDLFQKQRYAMMCAILKNRISKKIEGIKFAEKDIREVECNTFVSFNYIHSEPLLDIWWKAGESFVYTIQVQADSYEHGIQWLAAGKSAKELWEEKKDSICGWWMRSFDGNVQDKYGFEIVENSIFRDDTVFPVSPLTRKNKKTRKTETSYYGKYENSNSVFIYQTRKIESTVTVDDVLNYIVEDFKSMLDKLRKP